MRSLDFAQEFRKSAFVMFVVGSAYRAKMRVLLCSVDESTGKSQKRRWRVGGIRAIACYQMRMLEWLRSRHLMITRRRLRHFLVAKFLNRQVDCSIIR